MQDGSSSEEKIILHFISTSSCLLIEDNFWQLTGTDRAVSGLPQLGWKCPWSKEIVQPVGKSRAAALGREGEHNYVVPSVKSTECGYFPKQSDLLMTLIPWPYLLHDNMTAKKLRLHCSECAYRGYVVLQWIKTSGMDSKNPQASEDGLRH